MLWQSYYNHFSFIFSPFGLIQRLKTKSGRKRPAHLLAFFYNQNMCCASAPGDLVALIHHAVNSAAPSARAIFRTLAPSHRVRLRTARHLGSFSCRSSITFENLFVNGRICKSNKLSSYICDTSFCIAMLREQNAECFAITSSKT